GVLFRLAPEKLTGLSFPPPGWRLRQRPPAAEAGVQPESAEPLFEGIPVQDANYWLQEDGTSGGSWLSLNTERCLDPATGALIETCVSIQVSTRQKELERSVLESSHFIQSMAAATPEIFYIFDLEKQSALYVNRNLLSYLGYAPSEIIEFGSEVLPK